MHPIKPNSDYKLASAKGKHYLIGKRKYGQLEINDTGALIWKTLQKSKDLKKLILHVNRKLGSTFKLDVCDITEFLRQLHSIGAIETEITDDYVDSELGRAVVKTGAAGRFGNQLFRYCAVRILASHLNYKFWMNPIDGLDLQWTDCEEDEPDLDGVLEIEPVNALIQDFAQIEKSAIPKNYHLFGFYQHYSLYRDYKETIRNHWIKLPERHICKPPADSIVAHVRSDDLWSWNRNAPRGHWEPLTAEFYANIIRNSDAEKVYVVCSHADDPVAFQLHQDFNAEIISGDLIHDFRFLMAAPRIILSASTFAWWAAWLSDAKEVHFPLNPYFGVDSEGNQVVKSRNQWWWMKTDTYTIPPHRSRSISGRLKKLLE